MAETTSYAQLLSDVSTYTEDDSSRLTGVMPGIIARAQDRLQRDLKYTLFHNTQNFDILMGSASQLISGSTQRPSGMERVKSIRYTTANSSYITHVTRLQDPARIHQMNPSAKGTPIFFYERLSDVLVGPTPDTNYPAEIIYIAPLSSLTGVQALSTTNQTNFLTNNMARLLLYACLCEAEMVLEAPQEVQIWEGRYQQEKTLVLSETLELQRTDYFILAPAAHVPMPPPPAPAGPQGP